MDAGGCLCRRSDYAKFWAVILGSLLVRARRVEWTMSTVIVPKAHALLAWSVTRSGSGLRTIGYVNPQYRDRSYSRASMGSEEKPSIRFKRRFGFNGPSRWRRVEETTVDDFLGSIARRKELNGMMDHEPLGQLDYDPELLAVGVEPSFGSTASRLRMRRLAAVAAFWTGVILWLSGYLNTFVGPFSFEGIIQGSELLSAFEFPLKLAFVLFVFVIPVVSLWRGRRSLPAGS